MQENWFSKLKKVTLFLLLALLLSSSLSLAGEFSAETLEIKGGKTFKGKLYVKGDKMRREGLMDGKDSVMILRMDKGVMWNLIPENRTYMEIGGVSGSDSAEMEKAAKDLADKRELGTEMMSGFLCNKVQYIYHDKRMGVLTMWMAKELNHAVKMETTGTKEYAFKSELKNIRIQPVPESLFEIPKGYTRISTPGANKPSRTPRQQ